MLGLSLSLATVNQAASGGAPAATTTVLDATKKYGLAVIGTSGTFGANLKLTSTGDVTAPQCAGTTNQIPVGAKYYCEVTLTALHGAGNGISIGVADGTFAWTTAVSPGYANAGVSVDGRNCFIYPTAAHNIAAEAVGNILQMCVKRTSTTSVTAWFGLNNTWASGNPSTETGGDTVTLVDEGGGTYHCWGAVGVDNTVDQADCNFGQSAFTYAKPTSATAWV